MNPSINRDNGLGSLVDKEILQIRLHFTSLADKNCDPVNLFVIFVHIYLYTKCYNVIS